MKNENQIFIRVGRDKFVATYKKEKMLLNSEDLEVIESECAFI